jgi:hypothetical protein
MATTPKQQFLAAYDKEHATTMRVLRAYPRDKLDLKPAEKLKSARELGWVFVIEHGLGMRVYLRIAGAKVPSIYGPTADEPWI